MVGLHVNDLLGCGKIGSAEYEHLKSKLEEPFNFKLCGCHLSRDNTEYKLHHSDDFKKVKSMICNDYDANRSLGIKLPQSPSGSTSMACHSDLTWPATQTSPHLSASVSLLCGEATAATGDTAAQANKLLRFTKNNSDTALIFRNLRRDMEKLCMVAMSDAV